MPGTAQKNISFELTRFTNRAANVTVIRDSWGIPHIYGKSDADAVFGLMYTQCEENFTAIERNYVEMMGRLSELEGPAYVHEDLEMRLIYDSSGAIADYKKSPGWLKKLLDAFADGVNYFLLVHPEIKPAILKHFEPWFPLMYTDGSISATQTGGITLKDISNLYSDPSDATSLAHPENSFYDASLSGSNGFALAPSRTASKNAILYINPHVTFYFRTEVHMVSEEGLNAYGAVTWGQFFVYQGFNAHCGWMHTSSYADVADVYVEDIYKTKDSLWYRYDGKSLPVKRKTIKIFIKDENGYREKSFITYRTLHGPVMGKRGDSLLSLRENNRSLAALEQSWLRTKSTGFEDFKRIMGMRSNNSNNTVFADDKGNIAYWHGNFMPVRDPNFNWNLPVNGSISATEWKGIHSMEEMIHVYNPVSGWIENCNSTPFTVSGNSSPEKKDFPEYMAPEGQNARAVNAVRLLNGAREMTIEKMIREIGYNAYLTAFDILLPPLFIAYENLGNEDSLKWELKDAMEILKSWDRIAGKNSIACTIATEWAERLINKVPATPVPDGIGQLQRMAETAPAVKLTLLNNTLSDLKNLYGTWKLSWGVINRYQRTGHGKAFDDKRKSWPVGMASSAWGCIPSFVSRRFSGTKNRYGWAGNSFIACVEFGSKLKARTVITGGQFFQPSSKHFSDQAEKYIDGNFKEIYFYRQDVLKHAEKKYHPGQ